jgi:hypothetical protein
VQLGWNLHAGAPGVTHEKRPEELLSLEESASTSGPHTSCEWYRRVGRPPPYLHPIPPLRPAHAFANRGELGRKAVLKERFHRAPNPRRAH